MEAVLSTGRPRDTDDTLERVNALRDEQALFATIQVESIKAAYLPFFIHTAC